MNKPWSDKIRNIEPYIPGEQPQSDGIIKLNTNENPYPPSPRVTDFMKNFDTDKLRLYPSFKCPELKEVLGEIYKLNENQIFLGNGSDEVLALCFMTFFNSHSPILFPDITYSFYDVWCNLFNIKFKRIPLDESFKIIPGDYFADNGGVVIANPNAPTGRYLELSAIEEIVGRSKNSIVIIDEAYIDFGGKSAMELINKYDNLVVVHTFSKSRSLAGIRVGYAAANPELIAALEAVKNSFNSYTINTVSQLIAAQCASDTDYFNQCMEKIIQTRQWTVSQLDKLGFETLPSCANFIFPKHPYIKAEELFEYLKSKNIFVRYFNKPRINDRLRITIGTDSQMEALVGAIKDFIAQNF